MTILFKGKIICGYCKKKHVHKNERGRIKYICSHYNRKSGNCVRNLISQDQIMELMELKFRRLLSKEEIDSVVDYIEVTEDKIQINFYEEKEVILSNTYGQF